jgi:hypothetical protein
VFSSEEIEKAKKLVAQLGQLNLKQNSNTAKNDMCSNTNKNPKNGKQQKSKIECQENGDRGTGCINLLPSELLVIAGIVCDVLQVQSVLVDRRQAIEVVLVGSLKQHTQLDKVMEQIGKMPFDQVVKSILECSSDKG